MKVLVTGSSGLVGSALVESLAANGHLAIRLPRGSSGNGPAWDPYAGTVDLEGAEDIDVVVHLAGENISDGRWNGAKKARIIDSRVKGTRLLAEFFAAADHKPRAIVSASAVGFYGDSGEMVVDESSEPGDGFLADVCKKWEEATAAAVQAGIRVVNIRLGVVLSAAGGALKKMLLPFKLGAGGVIGSGNQFMSWISIEDVIEAIQYAMVNDSLLGPVNLVSPNAVTNREFTQALGQALHRPTMFPMPAFAARLVFGEMADELLLAGTRTAPRKLMECGYEFRHPELTEALDNLLKKPD